MARKIAFELTFKEFIQVIEGTEYIEKSGSRKCDLQIDRIDASKSYSFGNVRVVTQEVNVAKSNIERHLPEHIREMRRRKGITEPEDSNGDNPF